MEGFLPQRSGPLTSLFVAERRSRFERIGVGIPLRWDTTPSAFAEKLRRDVLACCGPPLLASEEGSLGGEEEVAWDPVVPFPVMGKSSRKKA